MWKASTPAPAEDNSWSKSDWKEDADEAPPEPEGEEEEGEEEFHDHGEKRGLEDYDEDSPAKRARNEGNDAFDEGQEVDRLLFHGQGNQLSIKQLREWLEEQGLETSGLKKQLLARAEEAVQRM